MTQDNQSNSNSAEKRALWEVRQRYGVKAERPRTVKATPPGGTTPPPKRPLPPREPAKEPAQPRRKKHWVRNGLLLLLLLLVLSGGIFGYKILAASNKISTANKSILGQVKDLLFTQGRTLKGEKNDRINVLLLAIGGEGHSGENLTDTIMLASIRPSDHSVALMSIPRDLYVQLPGEQYFTKLNAVHAYAEAKKSGSGPDAIRQKIEQITGQPIDYYARVDFTGFKEMVDAVGGVNITIENSFFDYWHKIAFSKGTETMNGERALAYVRARYIEGPEGGDFKRAARQQQVLLALRDKVFSVNTALDFNKLSGILDSVSNNVRTDMDLWEMKRFYEMARQVDRSRVTTQVLTNGPKGVLTSSTVMIGTTPAYILKPRLGDQDYSEIQALAGDIFNSGSHMAASADLYATGDQPPADQTPPEEGLPGTSLPQASTSPSPSPAVTKLPTIEIRNGTNTTGLAKSVSDKLTTQSYKVTGIGNAATRDTAKTVLYTLTSTGQDGAAAVQKIVGGKTSSDLPSGEKDSSADILIILGQDIKP